MDRPTAIRPVEEELSHQEADDQQELSATIRATFSELSEKLVRLGDLYGDTLPGSHARRAASAAKRARKIAERLP